MSKETRTVVLALTSLLVVSCQPPEVFLKKKPEPRIINLTRLTASYDSFNIQIPLIDSPAQHRPQAKQHTTNKIVVQPRSVTIPAAGESDFLSFKTNIDQITRITVAQRQTPKPVTRHFLKPPHYHVVRKGENIRFCDLIDRKLASVSLDTCLQYEMTPASIRSSNGRAIFYTDILPVGSVRTGGRVLVLGGVHGDELTSVSTVFLWMKELGASLSNPFSWRIVPLVNPDGFFRKTPTRTNANGVDLNRNLPTPGWNQLAFHYWQKYAKGSKRKFPGDTAASEPESQWLISEINRFKPDIIVTVHAPYNLVDFDARDRTQAPRRLGILEGRMLGTFPGSLGRYAGEQKDIPVITIELPHSLYLPNRNALQGIFTDLVNWLGENLKQQNYAEKQANSV